MKRRTMIICLVGIAVIAGMYFLLRESFDRFNPWLEEAYVYVVVENEPADDNGRYKYREQGVTAGGETKKVVFTASTRLAQGTHLKVLAKGTYTASYQPISADEMP